MYHICDIDSLVDKGFQKYGIAPIKYKNIYVQPAKWDEGLKRYGIALDKKRDFVMDINLIYWH